MWGWLLRLSLGLVWVVAAIVALCGLIGPHEPSCPPPAHVEEHRP